MHLRFVISLIVAVLSTPAIFAQGTNQPTVDDLVAKNIEAKGGAAALNSLQTLRSTGKLLVPVQGQIRSEEHTSELQSHSELVCRLLLEKKNYIRADCKA